MRATTRTKPSRTRSVTGSREQLLRRHDLLKSGSSVGAAAATSYLAASRAHAV